MSSRVKSTAIDFGDYFCGRDNNNFMNETFLDHVLRVLYFYYKPNRFRWYIFILKF